MIAYLLIFISLTVLAALIYYFYIQSRDSKDGRKLPPEFEAARDAFKAEIDSVQESIRLLENFVGDYFVTMNESGFKELCEIAEALSSTLAACNELAESGELKQAQQILDYVYFGKGSGTLPASLENILPNLATLLMSWQARLQTRIKVIEKNLSEASEEFKKIGRIRKGPRRPTLTILEEVRKMVFGGK